MEIGRKRWVRQVIKKVAGIIDKAKHEKGKSLLYAIVCMLSKMIVK